MLANSPTRESGNARFLKIVLLTLLFLGVGSLSGCESGWLTDPFGTRTPTAELDHEPTPAAQYVTVRTMADRLDLEARQLTRSMAMLHDANNNVFISAPPDARLNVNGQSLPGEIRVINDLLYVTRDTMRMIETSLDKSAATDASDAARTAPRRQQSVPVTGALPRISGVVMLDAGHGGRDPGAPNSYGPPEKVIALDTTVRLKNMLESMGARVIMTRESDTYPTLDARIDQANRMQPRLYVSIHADTAPNTEARGFTVYVARSASRDSMQAASLVAKSMEGSGVASRGVRRADFRVVKETHSPAILVELGYLTNAAESRLLGTAAYRAHLAEAIARGIGAALRR